MRERALSRYIALIRGINVGRAKRISMSDLKALFSALGHENVRTLLNSGNVLFHAPRQASGKLSAAIESAIFAHCGVSASTIVIDANDFSKIIDENPLLHVAIDHSRHLIAFVANPKLLTSLNPLLKQSWAPDMLAISARAAYLWCEAGVLDSKLSQAFGRKAKEGITTRNWATVLKLQAALNADA